MQDLNLLEVHRPRRVPNGTDHPDSVFGKEGANLFSELLRRLICRHFVSVDREDQVTAGNRPWSACDVAAEVDGHRRLDRRRRNHVIVRALIRFENEPSIGRLTANRPECPHEVFHIIAANSEEHGARRAGSNHDPRVLMIVVVEGRRVRSVHPTNRLRVYLPRRSPRDRMSVRENLIRPVMWVPGRCSGGTDDSPAFLVLTHKAQTPTRIQGFFFRDDSANGPPIEAGGRRTTEHDKGWIRRGIFKAGPPFDESFNPTYDRARVVIAR